MFLSFLFRLRTVLPTRLGWKVHCSVPDVLLTHGIYLWHSTSLCQLRLRWLYLHTLCTYGISCLKICTRIYMHVGTSSFLTSLSWFGRNMNRRGRWERKANNPLSRMMAKEVDNFTILYCKSTVLVPYDDGDDDNSCMCS
ncbi:hypothetical protein L873DRAFT_956990 [Choiromyces venosus 120613-1]|uniref:Uncharacterized protein n=1 Tax=Choiromyces venosus 120613-1 TaxID=1336337 RepID=A0A3N4KH88_9PEZI|nr:hypothetical protein L873DRAFT_956990 [Choiromyces venosus 120613-1]